MASNSGRSTSGHGSRSRSNSMNPPSNNSPPNNGGNGHRKSSSLNRGWFEGTMEVISGMGAPRPITPSSQALRPASAPNSPARGLGGLFGGGVGGVGNNNNTHGRSSPHHHFYHPPIDRTNSGGSSVGGGSYALPKFPGDSINRLPSQDSLDRSIHNESGHGKSTAQIIRDLKHSNSALSAKIASLEKGHMNDLSDVEGSAAVKRKELEQTNAKQRVKLIQYEQYKAAADSKLKQQAADLTKVKEESAFQRHSISDLKNQYYQLQQELDERDEEDEVLNQQQRNVDADDDDEGDLRRPHSDDGRHNLPRHPNHSRGNGLVIAPSSSSMSTEDLQQMTLDNEELVKEIQELQDQLMEYQGYDKKLIDLQRQLEAAQTNDNGTVFVTGIPPRPTTPPHPLPKQQQDRERPPLAPSSSRDRDDIVATEIYRHHLQDPKGEIESQNIFETEDDVQEKMRIDVMEIETRVREEQNERIAELEEQLEQYVEKLAEVGLSLAESRQQAKNQEQYRKDEAEDLRMIQDANESEIVRLEKEFDESSRELELRDEELEEIKQKYLSLLNSQEKEDEKKDETGSVLDKTIDDGVKSNEEYNAENSATDDSRRIVDLEEQLYNSVEMVDTLKLKFEETRNELDERVANLELEKAKLLCECEEMSRESKIVGSLNKDIETMEKKIKTTTEAEKVANEKVKHLEKQFESLNREETLHSTELSKELKLALTQVTGSKEEITRLKDEIYELEHRLTENKKESDEQPLVQTEPVTLKNEEAIHDKLVTLISTLKKEKEKIEEETKEQLMRKDEELAAFQKVKIQVELLEGEKMVLERAIGEMADNKEEVKFDASLGKSRSVPSNFEAIQHSFESKIETINEEKILIETKIRDRDTTIATLLRSSIVLENKIESLEVENEGYRSSQKNIEAELDELRNDKNSRTEEYSKITEEMKYLKGQLRVAKADAKRWKRALKEDGTTSSEYRYQISTLQKANENFAETILERDQAIQNLVNQSMVQESHVRDLKTRISSLMKEVESIRMKKGRFNESSLRVEIDRLREESEIFAGQIIEQDEEFKRMQRILSNREEQISSMKTDIEVLQKKVINDNDLIGNVTPFVSVNESLSTSESDLSKIKYLQAALDEMQEATESNRIELRDLRQQLREAKETAGSATDLRVELNHAKLTLDEYMRNNLTEKNYNDDTTRRCELDESNAKLLHIQSEKSPIESKVNDRESELHGSENELSNASRDACNLRGNFEGNEATIEALQKEIKAYKEEIKNIRMKLEAETENFKLFREKTDSLNNIGNDTMEKELKVKINEINVLNDQLKSSQDERDELNRCLQSKSSLADQLNGQIKVLQNDANKMHEQHEGSTETPRILTDQSEFSQEERDATRKDIVRKTECITELDDQVSLMQDEIQDLRETLQARNRKIQELEDEVIVLTGDIEHSRQDIQDKTNIIRDFDQNLRTKEIELNNASNLKMKLGSQLADSLARLGALERELSDAITATSSNEDLSRKNQTLVQENASLYQRNENFVKENESLEKINDDLAEEIGTLTKDNQVLCLEIQASGRENESLNQIKESLDEGMKSLTVEKELIQDQNDSLSREKKNLTERVQSLSDNIHTLNESNNSLTEKIVDLSNIAQDLRGESMLVTDKNKVLEQKVASLSVNVDSLNRSNLNLNEDIKMLCNDKKSLKDSELTLDDQKKSLDQKIASLCEDKISLNNENRGLRDEVGNLNNENSSLKGEKTIIARKNDDLEEKLKSLNQDKESLCKENEYLVEENKDLATTIDILKEKNDSLSVKSEAMMKDMESLKADIDGFSRSTSELEELKVSLVDAERDRTASEQSIIDNYERQLSALSSNKDTEIDSLRKCLTESREKNSDKMEEMITQLSILEEEKTNLRKDLEIDMQSKDQQVFALEHTLHAQEQIVDTMRSEMDQLQSGMEHTTKSRRDEVEEMQQEVMQVEAKALKQEREIVALKMQLEERKLEHKADVVQLKDALVKAMEQDQDSPLKQTICDLQNNDRMLEVRERLEQLKARNTDLQEENLNLGGRLERAAIQISSFEVEKQQAEEIEEENIKLRQQLKEYELLLSKSTTKAARSVSSQQLSKVVVPEKESNRIRPKDRKKKKFSLFKRKSIDGSISETKEEDFKGS